jgi:alpha-L-fucosidase
VEISSPGLNAVSPGYINRLQPGDQAKVQIGVVNADGGSPGTTGNATVIVSGIGINTSYTFNVTFGIKPYEATYESIYSHETPSWYQRGEIWDIHPLGRSTPAPWNMTFLLSFSIH